ncbi:MAG: BNR-4 repeat-containing protein [Casimicrobiaceae bacterium]
MTRSGVLQVGSYDHDTKETFAFALRTGWGSNDHGSGSILVLPDRRLMVFYARHNGIGLYCRSTTQAEDISEWGEEAAVTVDSGVVYSNPVYRHDEGLIYVFWCGADWKPAYATSGDGVTWSAPRTLFRDAAHAGNEVRPYFKMCSDGGSIIHFAFTDGHPRDEAENCVYHFRYERQEFRASDGTLLGHIGDGPISPSAASLVYDGKPQRIPAWIWDLALDQNGNPVIAYVRLARAGDHRYHYAQWCGEAWSDRQITRGGRWFPQTPFLRREREPHYSGGIALDHANPSTAYLSRQVGERFEIEKWTTTDGGEHWDITPITSGSVQDNVRPVVPRGIPGDHEWVLWLQGRYVHYTNYATRIAMHVVPD